MVSRRLPGLALRRPSGPCRGSASSSRIRVKSCMLKLRSFSDSTPWPWGHHHAPGGPEEKGRGGERGHHRALGSHWTQRSPHGTLSPSHGGSNRLRPCVPFGRVRKLWPADRNRLGKGPRVRPGAHSDCRRPALPTGTAPPCLLTHTSPRQPLAHSSPGVDRESATTGHCPQHADIKRPLRA